MRRTTSITLDLGDGGAAMREMRRRLGLSCDNERSHGQRLEAARRKVMRNCRNILDVFDAIVRNGSNRRDSIDEIAKRGGSSRACAKSKYYRGRKKLVKLFNIENKEKRAWEDI